MLAVAEAAARIAQNFAALPGETIPLETASGRVLAQDAAARLTQPPAAVSAMDGYAIRAGDGAAGRTLTVIGSAPAGHPFAGTVGAGQTVRIFTGAVVPHGADAILIQENAQPLDGAVRVIAPAEPGKHIRKAGLDFTAGDVLAAKGRRLTARDLALLAAGDIACVSVTRKPRIAFCATGDELTRPGAAKPPGAIVASSGFGLSALITAWGGEPVDLGIVPDRIDSISALPARASGCDLLITLGGASAGDHDLIQKALAPMGLAVEFWKIAMRPGKPLLFGMISALPLLGLPGNPVSTLVCAHLFLRPAIAAMLGTSLEPPLLSARLTAPLKANDSRQDYLRATLQWRGGEAFATAIAVQDSSMLSVLAKADGLIIRAPHADALPAGAMVQVLPLG